MNKALNTGYSATPAASYGPGPVQPPTSFVPPAGTSPMKPIDHESDFSKIIHSIDSGLSNIGHIEDPFLRAGALGYGLQNLGRGIGRRLMPQAFDGGVEAGIEGLIGEGIEMMPLAIF